MIYLTIQSKKIPALGFGTWKLKGVECTASLQKALEIGYRHVDTAQIYENEAEVGEALSTSGVKREDIFLTTKVWMSEVRDGALQKSVDVSLKKLKTDYVDMLLIHWPVKEVPFAEQLKALQQVQTEGKAKLIGVSNFTVAQMKEVVETIGAKVANNQVEYHPYLSQQPVLDYVRAHGMFLTAYTPLARGKISDDLVLNKIARKRGKTTGQVSLRWLLQQESVATIPKAASEKHMRENFDIFDFTLDAADMKEISSLARTDGRIVNPDWSPAWDKTGT